MPNSVRTLLNRLICFALLAVVSIILSKYLTIQFNFGILFVSISFEFIPFATAARIFGGTGCAITMVLSELYFIFMAGASWNNVIQILIVATMGFLYGMFLSKGSDLLHISKAVAAKTLLSIIYIIFAHWGMFSNVLPWLVNIIINAIIEIIVIFYIFKLLDKTGFSPVSKNVSGDNSIAIAMKAIELLCDTKNPDYPMLQVRFYKDYIDVFFIETGHGDVVSLMNLKQHQSSLDQSSEAVFDKMIGDAFHASELPSDFIVEFGNDGSGYCDKCTIRGKIFTEHKNAEKDYMEEIASRCRQKNIEYKMGQKSIKFLMGAR